MDPSQAQEIRQFQEASEIKTFLTRRDGTRSLESKKAVTHELFTYLTAEPRVVMRHEKFRRAILRKLIELEVEWEFESRVYLDILFTRDEEDTARQPPAIGQ